VAFLSINQLGCLGTPRRETLHSIKPDMTSWAALVASADWVTESGVVRQKKMNLSKQEVQRFISLGYATDALKFADHDCTHLAQVGPEPSMAFLSGITSLVTHYARPFKRSRGIPILEESFVPAEHLPLHRFLIEARDKAHAHLDRDLGDPAAGQLCHEIRLLKQRDSKHYWVPARLLPFGREKLTEVRTLISVLLAKLDIETDVLEGTLLPFISQLPSGLYILSELAPYFVRDVAHDGIDEIADIVTIN